MRAFLGVIGPSDLVDLVVDVAGGIPQVELVPLPYEHEDEARELVEGHQSTVDAWLFTGILPYTATRDLLTAPASYLDYNGSTILQGLVRLLREGRDVTRLSIDTLRTEDVLSTFQEVGIPTDLIHVLPFREGLGSAEAVQFHRDNILGDGSTVVLTCVSSVYERVTDIAPTLRLVPSVDSITTTVSELLLRASHQVTEQSQVAVGLLDLGPAPEAKGRDWVDEHLAPLGATSGRTEDGLTLIVTTRGALDAVTAGFTSSPFRFPADAGRAGLGFGVGNSAIEAEKLARRALARATSAPGHATFVSFRSNSDLLLPTGGNGEADRPVSMGMGSLAARTGLSPATLERMKTILDLRAGTPITTRDLASGMDVQQRTARRLIRHFEMVGLADRVGFTEDNQPGRPLTLYRIKI